MLAGNVKIPNSQNVGIVVPFTKTFDFVSVHGIKLNGALFTIFLGELNGNNGASFVFQELAESVGIHECSCGQSDSIGVVLNEDLNGIIRILVFKSYHL